MSPWITPALLAVVGIGGMGSYGQLSAINDQIAEQNRLAEARGQVSARLESMDREIQTLRLEIKGFALASDVLEDRRTIIASMNKLRTDISGRVTLRAYEQQINNIQGLITTLSNYMERLVTHEQLQILVGRVDAISAKLQPLLKPEAQK